MIRLVLTDIEGTTSSIEFVHKVLFPYSRENFARFLAESADPEVKSLCEKLWVEELKKPASEKVNTEAVATLLQTWIDQDLKQPTLKALQGKIWKKGYESGAYKGHVYPEVALHFKCWKDQGLRLGIYSSGSMEAQKLLFRYSEAGDLTPFIDFYFDTAVGTKREVKSYETISERLETRAEDILFLSDIKEELDAAKAAGMKTLQLLRDPLPAIGTHPTAKTFDDVSKQIESF